MGFLCITIEDNTPKYVLHKDPVFLLHKSYT